MRRWGQKLAILGVVMSVVLSANAETLHLAADEWCPFNCVPNSVRPGILIEVAKEIFEPAGILVDYQILPWARALSAVRSGAIDGLVGAGQGDAPDLVFPGHPLAFSKYLVFALAQSKFSNLKVSDLDRLRLGVISEYSYGKTFDSFVSSHSDSSKLEKTSGEDALQQNIKKLSIGRLDGVVSSPEVFYWEARKLGLARDQFKQIVEMPENDAIYIALSPKNKNLEKYKKLLSDGVTKLKASGRLDAIRDMYLS